MTSDPRILGVHPIAGSEPCYLIEIELPTPDFKWHAVTQPQIGVPRESWQVAYDEQPLDAGQTRWVFFFHYLDTNQPLQTSLGPLNLPPETQLPPHLTSIPYEPPG